MKRIAILILALAAIPALAQTSLTTVPAATAHSVKLTWTNATSCTSADTCTVQVYRYAGACSGATFSAASWTALPVSAANATTLTDGSVTSGTYCYTAETLQGGQNSAPSSTVQVTIPNPLQPPTGLAATAQ